MRIPAPAALLALCAAVVLSACTPGEEAATGQAAASAQDSATAALIARAKTFELPTEYVPPPGEAIDHHTSGFAKILCSAVFITGLEPADAAENVGYFTSPYDERAVVTDTVFDYDRQEVRLTLPSGVVRVAKKYRSQGCITRPIGQDSIYFTPETVEPNLPPAETTPWPMGDALSDDPYPAELDMAKVAEAVDAAFGPPEAMTEAFLVTYKGRIIGERYGEGIGIHTPLESWSMGIVRPVMKVYPYAWGFFVPFILIATFTMLNLFIAVVVNAMQSRYHAVEEEHAKAAHDERVGLLEEVRALRADIRKLTKRSGGD